MNRLTEIPNPTVEGPRIMIACVGIGTFTGFIFLMVLLLVAGPVEAVIESEADHSAFNAIISASVVALGVSYAMPIAINCLRGRKMLGQRPFVLPEAFAWLGWFNANALPKLGIAYVIVTTVLFLFPPELPVTGSNMNYCIVAFAIVLIISTVQWFIDGRKNFKGPSMDQEILRVDSRNTAASNAQADGDGDGPGGKI
ncbi:MAG: hypothetical protein L6R40_004627 [Gallowayella cf. fulva]|nr:MAG: hypothetical protein L6R40_004627 [Xanthomendoza cf. fulva]